MRIFYSFLMASALLLTSGCTEITPSPNGGKPLEQFAATLESFNAQSKTTLNSDMTSVIWSKEDLIAVFMGTITPQKFEISASTAESEAGVFNMVGEADSTAKTNYINTNVGFYPYSESITCNRTVNKKTNDTSYTIRNVVLPLTQTYTEGSFGNGSAAMTAVSKSADHRTLKFLNALGAIKLPLIGKDTIKSISFQGNNGELISGTAAVNININTLIPAVVMLEGASSSVTLDCGEGVALSENNTTDFFIMLPPVNLSKGYTISVTNSKDKTKAYKVPASTSVTRSAICTTAPMTIEPDPEEDNTTEEEGNVIPNVPEPDYTGMSRIQFTESSELFANPERGFYKMFDFTSASASTLNKSTIEAQRAEHTTLFYTGYYLTSYINSSIDEKFLNMIRTNMKALRDNGAKCILRFAYTTNNSESNKSKWDATPEYVQRHIQDLTPIIQEYSDVILCWQAGFVGVWGEWYYTNNFVFNPTTPADHKLRKEVIESMLAALPADRQVALRTPMFKRMMYASSYTDTLTIADAYSGSARSRICSFNDCFGATENDKGTFEGNETREYWKAESKYVIMGGETCGVSEYCTCKNSLKDLEDYHWTYLHKGYNADVLSRWESSGCMDEIKRRLGYRLSLADVYHSPSASAGEDFQVVLRINNTGFAAPMNPRDVELVLVDGNGKKTVYKLDDLDPRYWFAGKVSIVNAAIQIPSDASGKCTLYLNLPDPKSTLRNNPKFSIRLANKGVWDDKTGYNRVMEFTLRSHSQTLALP